MYLYGTVPTACLSLITCTVNHLTRPSLPASLSIPYSSLLLMMMIPMVLGQQNVSLAAANTTSTADSLSDFASSTQPSTSNSSDICQQVFADGHNEVTMNDSEYESLQNNYTFFVTIMERKSDCTTEPTLTLEPTTCSRNVTCGVCLNYYKQWLCSTANNYTINGTSYPPCQSLLCERVKRACPYIHPVDVETIYSSEPGFLCKGGPDNLPCYLFSTDSKRDNSFLRPYRPQCSADSNSSRVCILERRESSASTLSASNVTIVLTVLLTLLYTSYS